MTPWGESRARLARRQPWLIAAAAVIVALAMGVSGLAGARSVIGWWAGPRSIGVGTDGADALAVSLDGRTLYAANWDEGNSGGITVVNLATGRAGKRIGIGGPAVQLAMMPGGRTLYALVELDDNSDRLVRVGLAAQRADARIAFRYGAEEMVAPPTGSLLYVLAKTSRDSMAVIPVDGDSGQQGKHITVPADAQSMDVSPDGRTLYIGTGNADGKGPGELIPVDARTGKAGHPVRFPHALIALTVSPDGRRVFALASSYQCTTGGACGGRCELVGIDTMTGVTLRPVSLEPGCDQVEAAPGRHHIFVLNADNSLTAVDSIMGRPQQTIRTTGVIDGEGDSDFLIAPRSHRLCREPIPRGHGHPGGRRVGASFSAPGGSIRVGRGGARDGHGER